MATGNDPAPQRYTGTTSRPGLQRHDWPFIGRNPEGVVVEKLDIESDARRLCQDPPLDTNRPGIRTGQNFTQEKFRRTHLAGNVRLPGDSLPAGRSHSAHLRR